MFPLETANHNLALMQIVTCFSRVSRRSQFFPPQYTSPRFRGRKVGILSYLSLHHGLPLTVVGLCIFTGDACTWT